MSFRKLPNKVFKQKADNFAEYNVTKFISKIDRGEFGLDKAKAYFVIEEFEGNQFEFDLHQARKLRRWIAAFVDWAEIFENKK